MKKIKIINSILALLISVSVFSVMIDVNSLISAEEAEENIDLDNAEAGDTLSEDSEITTMDKDGNIYSTDLVVETAEASENQLPNNEEQQSDVQTRAVSIPYAVVNFNTKPESENTNFTDASTGKTGYINGKYGSNGAYIEHSSDGKKVKFVQAGVTGWVNTSEVEVLNYNSSTVLTCNYYAVRNGRLYHFLTGDVKGNVYNNQLDIGPTQSYLTTGVPYYSYDGHYFYTSFAKMIDDYRNGNYNNAVNASSPYYNYYQYLSHRSNTNYTADQLNSYINSKTASNSKMRNMGAYYKQYENTYGSNATLMLAVSANESAWGVSSIALSKNNLFGHAAYDSAPGSSANGYANPQTSIYVHAKSFISEGYLDPCDGYTVNGYNSSLCNLGRYYGSHLGDKSSGINVKYASDPYWGEKAAAISWNIEATLGGADSKLYSVGVTTNNIVSNVYKEASNTSTILYTTGGNNNYPVLIIGKVTGATVNGSNVWYKIQSDPVLDSSRSKLMQDNGVYVFSKDYAYIHSSAIRSVYSGTSVPKNTTTSQSVNYQTHVQSVGWQSTMSNGATSGTTGQKLRLEGINISLSNNEYSGGITYQTHVQSIGWQDWRSNGATSGTTGKALRLEAIRIKLTGEMANNYDVYYRVHAQSFGWLDWAKNGQSAGTAGYAYRLEGIQIVLVKKNAAAPGTTTTPYYQRLVGYQTHVQSYGWQGLTYDGGTSGTTGAKKRLEGIKLSVIDTEIGGGISYRTHIQSIGWQDWKNNGALSGTTGKALRLEAIQIKLTGNMANTYDVYYRVHAQHYGWMGWAKNGESAGTAGYAFRLESVQVVLVPKGGAAPGSTVNAFRQK